MAVWAYDESRLGLHTIRRRRITARGTKPVGQLQQRFVNCYLYGAIAPASGDGFFLGLPKFNAAQFQVFLDEFARARPETLNVLLLDNSRCHTAQELRIPDNVGLLFQEPYAPELNPAERVWEHLKTALIRLLQCCKTPGRVRVFAQHPAGAIATQLRSWVSGCPVAV